METLFRINHRKESGEKSGLLYFFLIIIFCLGSIGLAVPFLETLSWFHYLFILFCIVFANFVEYTLHRFPMHRMYRMLKGIYKTHSSIHHRFFTQENIGIDKLSDIYYVVTNHKVVLLFISAIVVPVSLLFGIINLQLGLIFFITSMFYFLIYETTHLSCHLSKNNFLSKLPYFKGARLRHSIHHNTKEMRKINFNVSHPIMDKIFKTYKK